MDKRYEFFVSSTYEDLKDARRQVIQEILEFGSIPVGMELFSAADEDQWTLISQVIDQCDYYIVIVGGRYGSAGDDGMSFTEKEYRHAREKGKRIIAFLHDDPGSLADRDSESDPDKRTRLEEFRDELKKRLCSTWRSPSDLGARVVQSISKLTKSHPGVGWVRGDSATSAEDNAEMLRLRKRIEELESEAPTRTSTAPPGSESFAQGEERFVLRFTPTFTRNDDTGNLYTTEGERNDVMLTWNDVFGLLAPRLIREAAEFDLRHLLERNLTKLAEDAARSRQASLFRTADPPSITIRFEIEPLDTVIVQLQALGLIQLSEKNRVAGDERTYWKLTDYGVTKMNQVRAIPSSKLKE